MALNISPVHRNLHTRVTFLHLEFEDWFVVIGLAALTNIFGRWVDRNIFGIPMNVFLAVHRARAERAVPDAVQVWQAARLPEGFSGLAHQAADLLRHGARLSNQP